MSELKAIDDLYERKIRNGSDPYKIKLVDVRHPPVYLKSEADKVIAELKESHKREIEQLLIEIVELKAQKAQAEDDCAYWKMSEGNAANAMHETEEYAMQLYNELRHSKHKRCLAMARWCAEKWADIATPYGKSVWYYKWHKRWLELAEKFKEAQ